MPTLEFRAEGFTGRREPERKQAQRHPRMGTGIVLGAAIALAVGYAGGPAVSVEPSRFLEFGPQEVNANLGTKRVTVTNSGSAPLHITDVALGEDVGKDFHLELDGCTHVALQPGESCILEVRFIAQATGGRSAKLTITNDASDNPQVVHLIGGGTLRPDLFIYPSPLQFEGQEVGTVSAVQEVFIENRSQSPVRITGADITNDPTRDFTMITPCTPGTLDKGQRCRIAVQFTPRAAGNRSAYLSISDDADEHPHDVPLFGSGTTALITINPPSLVFGRIELGRSSAEQSITLRSAGTAPLRIASVSTAGPSVDDFEITDNRCGGTPFSPGRACTIDLRFSPRGRGSRVARLTIAGNAVERLQYVELSGTGIAAAISFQPESLEFGSQGLQSQGQARSVTLRSTGEAPLRIDRIRVLGDRWGEFRIVGNDCDGRTLPEESTCTINVVFTPSRRAKGPKHAALLIPDNAEGSPHQVPLEGRGVISEPPVGPGPALSPSIAIDPRRVDFHAPDPEAPAPRHLIRVMSTGDAPLQVGAARLEGPFRDDFRIEQDTCSGRTFQKGRDCTIVVLFAPGAPTLSRRSEKDRTARMTIGQSIPRTRDATLVIPDNAEGSPHDVPLTGSVTPARPVPASPPPSHPSIEPQPSPPAVSPAAIDFGNQAVNSTGPPRSVTVTNYGSAPMTLRVSITGGNAAQGYFTVIPDQNCQGARLAPRASCVIRVVFQPRTAGTFTAALQVASSATGSAAAVPLRGVGYFPIY